MSSFCQPGEWKKAKGTRSITDPGNTDITRAVLHHDHVNTRMSFITHSRADRHFPTGCMYFKYVMTAGNRHIWLNQCIHTNPTALPFNGHAHSNLQALERCVTQMARDTFPPRCYYCQASGSFLHACPNKSQSVHQTTDWKETCFWVQGGKYLRKYQRIQALDCSCT